jgi:ribosomal protein S12 methylthiotransferase accessory factor YcaO
MRREAAVAREVRPSPGQNEACGRRSQFRAALYAVECRRYNSRVGDYIHVGVFAAACSVAAMRLAVGGPDPMFWPDDRRRRRIMYAGMVLVFLALMGLYAMVSLMR